MTKYCKLLPNSEEFSGCETEYGFTIYYINSGGTISDYNGPPTPKCSTIQLPLKNSSFDHDHPFNILAKDISLEWNVAKPWPCDECFDDGHQCIGVHDSDNHNTYHCSKGGNSKKLGLILGSVIGGAVLIIIICCIVFIIWCQKNKYGKYFHSRKSLAHCWEIEANDYQNIENFLRNHGSGSAPKRFKYYDIKRITSSFKDKLGQGGFGSVYKGYLDDKNPVAVKFLSTSKGTGEEFINEVASISNTSHVNVVKLLGFCFEYNKRALVYEYMPNGSLEKYIFSDKSVVDHQLGWPTLFKIAVGIARGLEYLHLFCATRMVHFDIKPHNVLLDENFCPKISDFGLAKLCSENESMLSLSGARGTIGYIAPEVVCRNFGGVSHKSDVYSFGMMILEMVGGRKNSDIECNNSSQVYFPHWIYAQLERNQEIVLPSIENDAEKESAGKMVIVSLWCIQTDPSHRPTMNKVVEMLEGDLDILQLPPRPYLFSASNSFVADSSILH
ncbi:hypothetical protein LIER_10829 [Lithospermum erythrorhizon]|uniref:Protein kinase domain-containing protein n=1 Tax=Lithospermum erythrorhizon TaxID=34254 RepID=A0AAV3PM22_LITER